MSVETKNSDTCARLAAIKDIPTQRLIELAVAEAAGLISILPSAAERAHKDAQPNEPQGDGWISVEDKDNPPPEAKKVIVWLKLRGGDICDMAYYTGEDGWYYEGWDAPHHGVVTHWRPLPEPPKEA